jgi:myo-inositol-1(or 4)-monophosphatase
VASAGSNLPVARSGADAVSVALEASKRAAEVLRVHFGGRQDVRRKGRGNLATQADVEAEEALKGVIRSEFPDHGILAEESGDTTGRASYRWILDPLDGTFNYTNEIGLFCVSLALVDAKGPLVGLIVDPLRGEQFLAVRGRGTTVNGERHNVRRTEELSAAAVAFDPGYDDAKGGGALDVARSLWGNVQTLRVLGSCALGLAHVAAGRLDLYYHPSAFPWDYAAGWLLVQEAGGIITDMAGTPLSLARCSTLAGYRSLHSAFLAFTA